MSSSSRLQAWTALVLAAVLTFGPFTQPILAESTHSIYVKAQAAEAREDYDTALDLYQKAYQKSPQDLRMRTSYYRLKQTASSMHNSRGNKMFAGGDMTGALAEYMRAVEIDASNEAALQGIQQIRIKQNPQQVHAETSAPSRDTQEIETMGTPVRLKPISEEPLTLHMGSEDVKVIYQAIGKAAGINVLFDPKFNSTRIPVDLTNVSLLDALRIVGTLSNTFWRPVTENTIFVAENTRAKRQEIDELAYQTFYLSNAWQQNDLNDVQTAIRNLLTTNPSIKIFAVPSQNAIVMRATPDELLLAQKIIDDLDKARPEVVVDIAVMEVNRDKLRNIGLSWPGSISFALQPPNATNNSTTTNTLTGTTTSSTNNLTLNNLANLNANSFAVTVSAATANLLMTDSDTKILQNPRVRSTDQQKATLKIGSKIPIATGSFGTGVASPLTAGLVNTQFQYQDVGVNIELTPTVHYDHDVTMKLKIEVTSQSGSVTISGVTEPIISQRTDEQVIRLREGEAGILGGILQKQDLVTSSGIPGLGELPLLKYIFGQKQHEVIDDEIVFLLIPHIVRGPSILPDNVRSVDTGSSQSVELRRTAFDVSPVAGAAAQPVMNQQTSAQPMTTVPAPRPIQTETAEAAVPQALTQMRQSAEPPVPTNPAANAATKVAASPAMPPGAVQFGLMPTNPTPAVGGTFKVAVTATGAANLASVPMQVRYDPTKLSLTNVESGDLLEKDGQAVALVHRDDGPGLITIVSSRPPGAAGISGNGTVCVLTFQAVKAGDTVLEIARPGAVDAAQHTLPATAGNLHLTVK